MFRLKTFVNHELLKRTNWSSDFKPLASWPRPGRRFNSNAVAANRYAATPPTPADMNAPVVKENLDLLSQTKLDTASVLDFGCSNGNYCYFLSRFEPTAQWVYTGVDSNAAAVDVARSLHPRGRFEIIESTLPFQTGEFDVVLASGVLQYVEDFLAMFRQLRQTALRFIVVTRLPVWDTATKTFLQRVRHSYGFEQHPMHVFKRSELEQTFEACGCSITDSHVSPESCCIDGRLVPYASYLLSLVEK
jgi:putative methyltransferase (TIGR04325 family)